MKHLVLFLILIMISCNSRKTMTAAPEEMGSVAQDSAAYVPVEEMEVGAGIPPEDDKVYGTLKEYEEEMEEQKRYEEATGSVNMSEGSAVEGVDYPAPTARPMKDGKRSTKPQSVQRYELGRIVYDIPDQMQKLKTYEVVVRIARDTVDLKIYDGINITVDTIIRTSKTMQVELIDPAGDFFKIVSQASVQFIELDEHTTWNFFVTPLKSGVSDLVLVVSIMKDDNLKQITYNDTVKIETTNMLELKLWFQQYWQWIIGFLTATVIPVAIKLFQRKK